jgi:hypothetical protein
MKSARRGRGTSAVEVGNVSRHGFWLLIGEREHFVRFSEFPWFRDATIAELTNIEMPSAHHLYWPKLDVDLAVESIDHPERYPLISGTLAEKRRQKTATVREGRVGYKEPAKRRNK